MSDEIPVAIKPRLQHKPKGSGRYPDQHDAANIIAPVDIFPIQRLPVEVLCMIFLYCLGDESGTTTPITLKKVCRLWESVIHGIPSAWKKLALKQHSFMDLEDALNDYFCYRRHHKLEVDISLDDWRKRKFLGVVRDNLTCFESITGRVTRETFYELFGRKRNYDMSTIRSLVLESSRTNFSHRFQNNLQSENIEVLKLYNLSDLLDNFNIKSSFPRLTTLSLKGDNTYYLLNHSMVLTILSVASNLIEFSWTPSRTSGEGFLLASVDLPKLTKLHVNLQPFSANVVHTLNALEMPRLTDCHVDGRCNSSTKFQTLVHFLVTRGSCIQEMTLNNFPMSSEAWNPSMPNLNQLHIEGRGAAESLCGYLGSDSIFLKLPKLERLAISRRNYYGELNVFWDFAAEIWKGVKSHAQVQALHIPSSWGEYAHAEFRKLGSEHRRLNWHVKITDPESTSKFEMRFYNPGNGTCKLAF